MKDVAKKITKREFSYSTANGVLHPKPVRSRKFLAVFDGYRFAESTLKYAIQLTGKADACLVGLFLDDSLYHSYPISPAIKAYKNPNQKLIALEEKDQEKRDEAVARFTRACEEAGIAFTFHRNKNMALQELKQESIFADLIFINSHETFSPFEENPPTQFIRELLAGAQCPVMVVPDVFKPIDKFTFLYDGAPSSVFAIKMFSYIFNELVVHNPAEVFTVKEKAGGVRVPDTNLVQEFIKWHFPKVKFITARGNPESQIISHLRKQAGNELVILGAYRRSEISRWFKTSMADVLMKELEIPLFIAHN